jgi:hypothetical protein
VANAVGTLWPAMLAAVPCADKDVYTRVWMSRVTNSCQLRQQALEFPWTCMMLRIFTALFYASRYHRF